MAIRAVEANGASNKSFCSVETGNALRRVPGFEAAPRGFSPLKLRNWFLTLPGVTSQRWMDGDPANNHESCCARRTARSKAMSTASCGPSRSDRPP